MISKRLRYEILSRDKFTCRYCGASAPEASLTVDHVIPIVLGGRDEPTNLVTACHDCNAGKSSTSPDSSVVDDVTADALRWARAMQYAIAIYRTDQDRLNAQLDHFLNEWELWSHTDYRGDRITAPLDPSWRRSVERWLTLGLSITDLTAHIETAMTSQARLDAVWRYYCGIVWRVLDRIHEIAALRLEAEEDEIDNVLKEPPGERRNIP